MYLHKLKKPNGDSYLYIKEKYHVPGKGARGKTVKSLSYVSELRKIYEDPIVYFTQMAAEMTAQKKEERSVRIFILKTSEIFPLMMMAIPLTKMEILFRLNTGSADPKRTTVPILSLKWGC